MKIESGKTIEVIRQIEKVFEVYYSFSDSVIYGKSLEIDNNIKTLDDFHKVLEMQNKLKVVAISKKLLSIVSCEENTKMYKLNDVIVTGYLINTLTKDSKKSVLKSFNTQLLPGITDFDVLRAFQQLPGVKSPNQTASGLYVKGGSPDQNALLWNDIRIYHPGHLFGMISPINPDAVDKATFYTNTLPTNKGGNVASLIELTSNFSDSNKKSESFKVGLNMLYADLAHKVYLFNDKLVAKYSFRKSVAPYINSPIYKSFSKKIFQNTEFPLNRNENKFDFWDGALVIENKLNENNKLKLSSIIIKNDLDYSNLNLNAKLQKQFMKIDNVGVNLQYDSNCSGKINFRSNLSYSNYLFKYDRSNIVDTSQETFNKNNNISEYNINLAIKYFQSNTVKHNFGYDLVHNKINHLIESNNQNFGFNISERKSTLISNSIFFNTQITDKNYELNLGSRITNNKYNSFLFEPRINFIFKCNENMQMIASFEKRSQFTQQINENAAGDISLENYVWVLTDKTTIPTLISNQFNIGLIYKKNKFIIDIDGYIKKVNGITSFSNGIVFSGLENSNSIATISNGNSISNGLDISIQKEISKWKFWASYSFLNSENKIQGVNNDNYFKSNGNINHTFYLSSNYNFSKLFVTLGWLWNSGRPYSELDSENNITSLNNKKLPPFHSLDLSILYNINLNINQKIKTGLALNNIYNYKVIINKEISRIYSNIEDLNNPRYSSTNFYSLRFTPNVFLNFSF